MTAPTYEPTPVLDIVSFGYRQFFKNLLPLTKLALPFILFAAMTGGFANPELIRLQKITEPSLEDILPIVTVYSILMLGSMVMYYSLYASIRYVRDAYYGEIKSALTYYLLPRMSLFGIMGIISLYLVTSFFAVIITFIGFLLLILPGLAMLVGLFFLTNRFVMVWVSYMDDPSQGVINAFRQSWALTENNFWRTVGLCFVTTVLQTIINLPFSLVDLIMGYFSGQNPSFVANPIYPVLYSVLMALSYWAQFVIGFGGMMFVFYRFFFDLKSRKDSNLLMATQSVPSTYWTPPESE